ncbi:alpha/beta hydrolase [Actinomycetospora termitidis]|uniref:Alpha/beta hydrolase n=1 Tax=Actinomycetospora termitidis TaxID=3053470 RepID=A0ABT7M204_9PSEU|nr:alpha/beta hydrolase [Actinomycetospora sp. Odt1-22]MDL5154687.1 alpha/beta hydrolase [Actinomycetospora sp. Odt1-22]
MEQRRRSGRRRLTVAVLAGGLVLGACTGGNQAAPPLESSSPAPTSSASAPAAPPTPLGAPAQFVPCDQKFECAQITVPIDYAVPTGPTITIGIVRQPAADQANKVGALLVNPGGPGGSGIETVESGQVPADVAARFDVIGFDPRGVGRSANLACPVGPDTPYYGDPDPGDPADEAATAQAVERYDQSCGDAYRQLLPHLGTRDVARDMDAIRNALGQQQISYLGYSYGTSIGQVYGEQFPQRVRAMVLDGVVDVTLPGLDPSQAESFENSLRQFAADCARRPDCEAGPDAIGMLDRVRAKVEAAPLPVPGMTPLSPGLLELGVVLPLYSKGNWPTLAKALQAADSGDGAPFRRLAARYFEGSNSDTYNAVTCLDNSWPRNPEDVFAQARAAEVRAPHFSGNVLVSGLTCARWPVPQDPLVPPSGAGLPPTLVIGTTNDPATPYRNSQNLVRRLQGSALLTYRGDGHTVYGQGVRCVDDQVNRYLVTLALPAPNAVC